MSAPSPQPNVYLLGPRACGKTTVGRLLAQRLGRPFVDADRLFEERTGGDVAAYVAAHGWPAFRDLEGRILAGLADQGGLVAACGGGAVLSEANRRVLARGLGVYIRCPAPVLAARLAAAPLHGQRPSLTGRPIEEEVAQVLAERDPLYRACARFVVSGEQAPEVVARQLADLVAGLAADLG